MHMYSHAVSCCATSPQISKFTSFFFKAKMCIALRCQIYVNDMYEYFMIKQLNNQAFNNIKYNHIRLKLFLLSYKLQLIK